MYGVVVGMGEVGSYLINVLDREGHDVVAIDASKDHLADVEDEQDVATLRGHGGSPATLLSAKVDQADLLVTCTDDDEVNLVGALFGKRLGAKRTVARIQGTEYTGEDRGIHQDMLAERKLSELEKAIVCDAADNERDAAAWKPYCVKFGHRGRALLSILLLALRQEVFPARLASCSEDHSSRPQGRAHADAAPRDGPGVVGIAGARHHQVELGRVHPGSASRRRGVR